MGVFDWVTVARSNIGGISTGKVDVSIGTSLDATFGADYAHILGSRYEQVCDPMQFVFGPSSALVKALGVGLVTGLGGAATYVFGANTELKYQGPFLDVSRGPAKRKESEYYATPLFSQAPADLPPADPIDPVCAGAVKALGLLQVAVPAAFELIIHFKYGEGLNPTEYHKELENLKFCAYAVTSRIAAIIRVLENVACEVQIAQRLNEECTSLANGIRNMFTSRNVAASPMDHETVRLLAQIRATSSYLTSAATAWED